MHINGLPYDIIHMVLGLVQPRYEPTVQDWAIFSRAVNVCRRWRMIGLPLLYEYIKFRTSSKKSDMMTNAGIIEPHIECKLAKRLSINLYNCTDIVNDLTFVVDTLNANKNTNPWKRLTSLNIWTDVTKVFYIPDTCEGNDLLATISKLLDRLACATPNILDLWIRGFDTSSLSNQFIGIVATRYARQLHSFKCEIPCNAKLQNICMPNVKYLDICLLNSVAANSLQISSDNVTSIVLAKIPSNFLWSSLCMNTRNSHDICFSNLVYLYIYFDIDTIQFSDHEYIMWSDQIEHVSHLSFPKLSVLILNASYISAALIYNAKFPNELQTLHIYVSSAVYVRYTDVKFNETTRRKLFLDMTEIITQNSDFEVAHNLLNGQRIAKKAVVAVSGFMDVLEDQETDWRNADAVIIDAAVEADVALDVIKALNTATVISFSSLRTRDLGINEIAHDLRAQNWSSLPRLDSTVRKIVFTTYFKPKALVASFVVYISILLPQLEEVVIMSDFHFFIQQYKQKWANEYPHLSSIKVTNLRGYEL